MRMTQVRDGADSGLLRHRAVWMLVLAASAIAGLMLITDLANAKGGCRRTEPWFEGIVVESAETNAIPPFIRCHLVDLDASQYGDRYSAVLWDWPAVVLLVTAGLVVARGPASVATWRWPGLAVATMATLVLLMAAVGTNIGVVGIIFFWPWIVGTCALLAAVAPVPLRSFGAG